MELNSATDRITEESTTVQLIDGKPWATTLQEVNPAAGCGVKMTVGTRRTLLAGFTGDQWAITET